MGTPDTTGLSADLVDTLRLAARGNDARFAEYVSRALDGTLPPDEVGVDPKTYRYNADYPAPVRRGFAVVDFPSGLRTVSRGFVSSGHARGYARSRVGFNPDPTGHTPDMSRV